MDPKSFVRKMFGTDSIADMVRYQRMLVRTKDYHRLGLAKKISIGPSEHWKAPAFPDAYVARYGRMIDLGRMPIPVAQSVDGSILLFTRPLMHDRDYVGLPDVQDPSWAPVSWTTAESINPSLRDPAKDRTPMIPQRLTDRCEQQDGHPAEIPGTNFLVFQPLRQVVVDMPQLGTGIVEFFPDSEGRSASLLIDHRTGEAIVLFGRFDFTGAAGHAPDERQRFSETEAMNAGRYRQAAAD